MIAFAGLSHLGIVSSIVGASKGFDVLAFDPRADVVEGLTARSLPIVEPDLEDTFRRAAEKIRFTGNAGELAECDVVHISLDVPTDDNNTSNLRPLEELIGSVLPHVRGDATLVVLSQVPPGFTRKLRRRLDETGRSDLNLFCQVETLIFGRAVERAASPERFIVGCNDPKLPLPQSYSQFLTAYGCPVLPMRYESAELAKIAINVFLAASLSATNTMAALCEQVGTDWDEIAPTLRLDRRIGPHAYLTPGLGIGGGNIERDLVTVTRLAAEHGIDDVVVSAFLAHSRHRRNWTMRTLYNRVLRQCEAPVVAVWGLAYKANTHSTKNSPVLQLLQALSGVKVRLYDPEAKLSAPLDGVEEVESALDACAGADALLIMTAWDEFRTIPPSAVRERLQRPCVIDASGAWSGRDITQFEYEALGKS